MTKKASKKGAEEMDELLSLTQAAERRGVSRAAIADLVSRGRLRSIKVGGKPHVYAADVDGFEPEKPGPKGARKGRR
ncbi:MAG TPA: excisionase family DNA-binding protein [Pyrinomonadaceae bacterium]